MNIDLTALAELTGGVAAPEPEVSAKGKRKPKAKSPVVVLADLRRARRLEAKLAKRAAFNDRRRKNPVSVIARRKDFGKPRKRKRRRKSVKSACTSRHRVVALMDPGEWYAATDVQRLGAEKGVKGGTVSARLWEMGDDGTIERVPNPDYRPVVYEKGIPAHIQAIQKSQPEWLFRLAPEGEALRRVALMLL